MSDFRRLFFCFFNLVAYLFALPAKAASLVFFSKPVVRIFNDLVSWLLSVAGAIALLMLVIGGINYMISGGNPSNQEKARKIISYAVIGLGLILISYALVTIIEIIAVKP